jgi:hypothetical protein
LNEKLTIDPRRYSKVKPIVQVSEFTAELDIHTQEAPDRVLKLEYADVFTVFPDPELVQEIGNDVLLVI